jgi:hypothetical protein
MSWFNKSATVETAEIETDVDKLAHAEAENIFANQAFDLAVSALRRHNLTHAQMPFSYTTGEVTRIVTMCNDFERRRLERDVRLALARRNAALETRGNLLLKLGLIR